jgi:hypothetical protein
MTMRCVGMAADVSGSVGLAGFISRSKRSANDAARRNTGGKR